jgi:hypothetical protein
MILFNRKQCVGWTLHLRVNRCHGMNQMTSLARSAKLALEEKLLERLISTHTAYNNITVKCISCLSCCSVKILMLVALVKDIPLYQRNVRSESRCALRLWYVDLAVSIEDAVAVCCCLTVQQTLVLRD